jgi:hypothetical protein
MVVSLIGERDYSEKATDMPQSIDKRYYIKMLSSPTMVENRTNFNGDDCSWVYDA